MLWRTIDGPLSRLGVQASRSVPDSQTLGLSDSSAALRVQFRQHREPFPIDIHLVRPALARGSKSSRFGQKGYRLRRHLRVDGLPSRQGLP
jgi:hypothetical protein